MTMKSQTLLSTVLLAAALGISMAPAGGGGRTVRCFWNSSPCGFQQF